MTFALRFLPLVSSLFLISTPALSEVFGCKCTVVSDDAETVSWFKVRSALPLDCKDYNGVEVPFMNPDPGAFEPPMELGTLAGCDADTKDKVDEWHPKDYPLQYWLQAPKESGHK